MPNTPTVARADDGTVTITPAEGADFGRFRPREVLAHIEGDVAHIVDEAGKSLSVLPTELFRAQYEAADSQAEQATAEAEQATTAEAGDAEHRDGQEAAPPQQ